MVFWDVNYFLYMIPAALLAFLAQMWMQSAYSSAARQPAPLSGSAAARKILDQAGLYDVGIEQVGGTLTDHYDPSHRVLRLSPDVFHGRSLAAVGIAAHEAGHAIQHATHYAPLVVRNLAVPLAGFGSSFGVYMLMFGFLLSSKWLAFAGLILFSAVVVFQLINLPVEFDASFRAKRLLQELGMVQKSSMGYVHSVLNAAALTYVAGTLQSVMQLLYFLSLMQSRERDGERERW